MPDSQVTHAEMAALREGAGYYVARDYGVLRVQGPDAATFLHNLTTNEVKELPLGQIQYSALLDRKGMVQSLFMLLRAADDAFLMMIQKELIEKTVAHLNQMRIIQKVEITDESSQWALLWMAGPEAEERVGDALGVHGDMLAAENRILIPSDRASWHLWRQNRWSVPALMLLLPQTEVSAACELMDAKDLMSVSRAAMDIVRLEKGIPEYGLEIDDSHILLEAELGDTFSRSKGCYPGQEVVERISAYGEGKTPYKLKVLRVKGEHLLEKDSDVIAADASVGTVMRSLYDPARDETLVAAYIASQYLDQLGPVSIQEGKLLL